MNKFICFIVFSAMTIICTFGVAAAGTAVGNKYSLSLEDAVAISLANNLGLKKNRENENAAEGVVIAAKKDFDALFESGVLFGQNNRVLEVWGLKEQSDEGLVYAGISKRLITGTEMSVSWKNSYNQDESEENVIDPAYRSHLAFELNQPLLRGLGRKNQTAGIRAAEKKRKAAALQTENYAVSLAAQVKWAYWDLFFAVGDIEVKRQSVELAEQLFAQTTDMIRAGKLSSLERFQSLSEVARREQELIAAQRAAGVAEDQLKLLMNRPDWALSLELSDIPDVSEKQIAEEEIFAVAIENRPDLKKAEYQVEAAAIMEERARDDLRMDLNLGAMLGYGGTDETYPDALDAAFTDSGDIRWKVGVNLSMPLDNSFARGVYRQKQSEHSSARINVEQLRLEIRKEIRTAVRDVQLALKAIDAIEKTTVASLKRMEAEQVKFSSGYSTAIDVLAAQEAYSQALSLKNKTAAVYAKALAEIARIKGAVE